jgi:hypothetical protein
MLHLPDDFDTDEIITQWLETNLLFYFCPAGVSMG